MSVLDPCTFQSRVVVRVLALAGLAVFAWQPAAAQTTTLCGPEVKEAVARRLASVATAPDSQKVAVQAELYKQ